MTQATFFHDPVVQDIINQRGIYAAPGVYLRPQTLVYATLGMAQATRRYIRAENAITLDTQISGPMFGLGIKSMLDDRMFWVINYTHVNYGLSQIGQSMPLNVYRVDVRSRAVTRDISIGFGMQC